MYFDFDDGDIQGMMFISGDGVSGPEKVVQKMELEVWATNKANELLGRDGPYEGPCRYCGTEEDICTHCGCCSTDHVLLMQDRFESPEQLREYGFTRYIRAVNDENEIGISVASAYITKPEWVWEMMNEVAEKRRQQIEENAKDDLSPEVWADIDDLDFSQLD